MGQQQEFLSGAWSKIKFRGVEIDTAEWSIDTDGDDADLTSSGKPRFKRDMVITTGFTGRFAGNWKRSAQPTDSSPGLYRGEVGTFLGYVSPEKYVSVSIEIKSFRIVAATKDVVKYEYTFRATDWPTWPGQTHVSSSSSSQSASSSSSSTSSST